MKELWEVIQFMFVAIGGWLGWFVGGMDGLIFAVLTFVVIDYMTGVMCAIAEGKLSSEVGFKGLCRKILIFCMIAIGHIIDSNIIQSGSVIRTAIIFFYLSNEGISILENAARLGLPVPDKLKDVLEQLNETEDK